MKREVAENRRMKGIESWQDEVICPISFWGHLGWGPMGVIDEDVVVGAEEALDRAGRLLASVGQDPAPLSCLRSRLERRWVPADALVRQMIADPSVEALLRVQ